MGIESDDSEVLYLNRNPTIEHDLTTAADNQNEIIMETGMNNIGIV